jgi:carbamoyl-phosphate synthase large subunit
LDNKIKYTEISDEKMRLRLMEPNASRIFYIKYALQRNYTIDEICELTSIDPWFIHSIKQILDLENAIKGRRLEDLDTTFIRTAKQYGFSDKQIADLTGSSEDTVRKYRKSKGVAAVFKLVDTCAAEFEAYTPYYYSTYEEEDEIRVSNRKKIMILGGGPNRIGQGIEFDYCCCQASFALRELGYETIMVNSNPETVSTDYDTSDKLYFEPLTFEDVMNIIDKEKPDGIIVQFGGQTPLNLAHRLHDAGAPIIGTSVDSIDMAEDRDKFSKIIEKLKLNQPRNGSAYSKDEAEKIASQIGYPVLVRPSYVLGGRAMRIVYDQGSLDAFMKEAQEVSPEKPVLIDKFLEDAGEVDVDAISDGEIVVIGGIMEHIEEAGVHSGDSACVLPPHTLSDEIIENIRVATHALAKALKVKGLMNIQFAIKKDLVYVLEVNPRASRTVPFVSKTIGVPLAKIAAKVMSGVKLSDLNFTREKSIPHVAVKESVMPFSRFSGVDIILGPEMKSTGEVMGIDQNFSLAFYKSQMAAGQNLPLKGKVFISVKNDDKRNIVFMAKKLADLNFEILATKGTAKVLKSNNISVKSVGKIDDGDETILKLMLNDDLAFIINTPSGKRGQDDMKVLRSKSVLYGIPCITTMSGAQAAVNGIEAVMKHQPQVKSIQEYLA